MCTQARIPSPSRRTEIASSKSFAVSGSIVRASSSRRSTRPSRLGSGGSYGSNGRRSPRSTSTPSSAASIDRAGPSTRSTRARPRPGRATTRSPGPASPSPFRSRTSGTPGWKNGSPTTSFPRRATSTTTRSVSSPALVPEVPGPVEVRVDVLAADASRLAPRAVREAGGVEETGPREGEAHAAGDLLHATRRPKADPVNRPGALRVRDDSLRRRGHDRVGRLETPTPNHPRRERDEPARTDEDPRADHGQGQLDVPAGDADGVERPADQSSEEPDPRQAQQQALDAQEPAERD